MTKKSKHSIQQETFEISYDNSENALIFQQEISKIIKQKLSRLTDEVFDEVAPKDIILRIDSLEIDLGTVQYKQMENDIYYKFKYALHNALQDALIEAQIKKGQNAEFIIPEFALIDVFLLYLQTGVLPWWVESSLAEMSKDQQEKIDEIEDILEILLAKNPDLLKGLYVENRHNKKIIRRTITQFSDKSIINIFRLFAYLKITFIQSIYTEIQSLNQKSLDLNIDSPTLRKIFFEAVFSEILQDNRLSPTGQKQLSEKIMLMIASVLKKPLEEFWRIMFKVSQKENLNQVLQELIEENYKFYEQKDIESFWQESESLEIFKTQSEIFKTFSEEKMLDILSQIYPKEEKAIREFVQNLLQYLPQKISIDNLNKLRREIWEQIIEYLWQQQTKSFLDLEELFLTSLESIIGIYAQNKDKEKLIVEMAQGMPVFEKKSEEILEKRRRVIASTWQEKGNLDKIFSSYEEPKVIEILLDILPENEVNYLYDFVETFTKLLKTKLRLSISEKQVAKEIWQKIVDFLWTNRFIKISISALLQNVFKTVLKSQKIIEKYSIYEEILEEISEKIKELKISLQSFSEEKKDEIQKIWLEGKSLSEFLKEFEKILQKPFELSDLQNLELGEFYRRLSKEIDLKNISKKNTEIILETLWEDKRLLPKTEVLLDAILPKIHKKEEKEWKGFEEKTWFVQYDEDKVLKLISEVLPEKAFWIEIFVENLGIFLEKQKLSEKPLTSLRKIIWEIVVQYLWQKRFVTLEEKLFLENVVAKVLEKLSIKNLEKELSESKKFLQEKLEFEVLIQEVSLEKIINDFFEKGFLTWKILSNQFFLKDLEKKVEVYFEQSDNQTRFSTLIDKINWIENLNEMFRMAFLLAQFSDEFLPKNLKEKLEKSLPSQTEIFEKLDKDENLKKVIENPELIIFYLEQYLKTEEFPAYIIPGGQDFMLVMIKFIEVLAQKHESVFKQYLQILPQEKRNQLKRFHPTILEKLLENLPHIEKEIQPQSNIKALQELKKMMDDSKRLSKKWMSSEIYIKNAGLVMLAPYLMRYFKFLEMLDEKEFKSPDMAERAVLLLQYLASTQSKAEESDLVLNKILAGLPLDEPIETAIEMTEKEIDISEKLLQGIIQNWGALGKTKNDNLRASFLLREGKLLNTSKSWKLTIPNNTLDILLNKLPWSFKLVRLPWMEKPIEVEWEF